MSFQTTQAARRPGHNMDELALFVQWMKDELPSRVSDDVWDAVDERVECWFGYCDTYPETPAGLEAVLKKALRLFEEGV